jgi:hypothetical protein
MRTWVGRCLHHSLLQQFRKVEPIRGLILQSGPLTSSRGIGLAAYRIGRGGWPFPALPAPPSYVLRHKPVIAPMTVEINNTITSQRILMS